MSLSHRIRPITALGVGLALVGLLPATAPPAAARPAGPMVLARANLPTGDDLQFHRAGDWRVRRTTATLGVAPISDCFTGRPLDGLNATTLYRRDYTLRGDRAQPAVAVSLEFGSSRFASGAYATLRRWIDDYPSTLRELGYARASVDPWHRVRAGDRADFTVVAHPALDRPDADETVFEEVGMTRTAQRVTLVVMTTTGQDYSFSTRRDDVVSTYPSIRSLPAVAVRLGRDRTPDRVLRPDQLLAEADVPLLGRREGATIAAPGRGRRPDAATVCTDGVGLRELRATQVTGRTFVVTGRPRVLTLALQFGSRSAARRAAHTFTERIEACPKALRESGYAVPAAGLGWTAAPTGVGTGRFAEIVYQRPEAVGRETRTFESIGLTRVGDRLMITVYVVTGQDFNVSYRPEGDPVTEVPPHPQFDLIRAAAARLGS